jgi:peptidoglycan hydrolase-like protein with peptidoglycan-binding domain
MLLVMRGDRLPVVALCQVLLNAYRSERERIAVDGIFGEQTQRAVLAFQRARNLPLTQRVDGPTWGVLSDHGALQVHDHVDVFDPMLRHSARVLEQAGARPAFAGGMCNGVPAMLGELRAHGAASGRLVMLRFHGHGNRGVQAISYGTVAHTLFDAILGAPVPDIHHLPPASAIPRNLLGAASLEALHSQISVASLSVPDIAFELSLLRPLFHPCGSVEFHGCQVGGRQVGRTMLQKFADIVGVPAVGARTRQMTSDAVRFQGQVEVACPAGVSLRHWAKKLPATRSSPVDQPRAS